MLTLHGLHPKRLKRAPCNWAVTSQRSTITTRQLSNWLLDQVDFLRILKYWWNKKMADVSAPCLRSYWTHNYISSKVYKQIMTLPSCWSFKYPWEILTVSSKHWKWYLGLPHILPPTTDPHLHWAKRKPPKNFIRGLMNKTTSEYNIQRVIL